MRFMNTAPKNQVVPENRITADLSDENNWENVEYSPEVESDVENDPFGTVLAYACW
jgi:hypothetical protein